MYVFVLTHDKKKNMLGGMLCDQSLWSQNKRGWSRRMTNLRLPLGNLGRYCLKEKNKDNKKVTFGIMNKIHVLFQFSMTSFSHSTDNEKRQPPLSTTHLTPLTTVRPNTAGSFCSAWCEHKLHASDSTSRPWFLKSHLTMSLLQHGQKQSHGVTYELPSHNVDPAFQ